MNDSYERLRLMKEADAIVRERNVRDPENPVHRFQVTVDNYQEILKDPDTFFNDLT